MRPEHADLIASLDELRAVFPGYATPVYLRELGFRLIDLEVTGRTQFGGAHVLAWWLVQRCRPGRTPTKGQVRRLGHAAAWGQSGPTRLQRGWSFERLTTYVAMLG
jgi:hypothetical protein